MSADVAVILGTRPEAIKLAPVVFALRGRGLRVRVVSSGQHRQLLDQALAAFGLKADVDLQVMREDQDLPGLTARMVTALATELAAQRPRFAIVQGDAATTFAGALACFYLKIPCGHVEAGLRSGSLEAPWPEEMNRRLTDRLCTHHYPPTEWARRNLADEGIDPSRTLVTGQTGVDAALLMSARVSDEIPVELAGFVDHDGRRLIYSTGHRRESFGGGIREVASALLAAVKQREDCRVVLPAHPNPNVGKQLAEIVGAHDRMHLIGPVSYACSIWLMRHADAIVSDSGGIQEEAPSFGVPVLVTRDVTERPEGVEAGFLRLVGTRTDSVLKHLLMVLDDPGLKQRLSSKPNPYGDGKASERIAADVQRILQELPRG
ncbi:MAG TPA: UDP-N-acetylglucosamine 2-epimerase (non-hydrolyzing) [Candidatus Polarisedimenticolia bacterium]|nr:UDP-N-acetylglucosamine 2-epimerase (non-hydrolyzing) [Candidatus Polarisedimenticolia bacterium]